MSNMGRRFKPISVSNDRDAAFQTLGRVQKDIAQAEFINWPELVDSFRRDEAKLLALMAQKGWEAQAWRAMPVPVERPQLLPSS